MKSVPLVYLIFILASRVLLDTLKKPPILSVSFVSSHCKPFVVTFEAVGKGRRDIIVPTLHCKEKELGTFITICDLEWRIIVIVLKLEQIDNPEII